MTPQMMVAGVKKLAADWKFEAISAGYPGPVLHNRPVTEPHNLAKGWTRFDFQRAFKCPVKFMNDAAMQALGSYRGGKLLFLGLGTGLGAAMIVGGICPTKKLPMRTTSDCVDLKNTAKRNGAKMSLMWWNN